MCIFHYEKVIECTNKTFRCQADKTHQSLCQVLIDVPPDIDLSSFDCFDNDRVVHNLMPSNTHHLSTSCQTLFSLVAFIHAPTPFQIYFPGLLIICAPIQYTISIVQTWKELDFLRSLLTCPCHYTYTTWNPRYLQS